MTTTLQTTGTREIQFREAINECLRQEMERDDNVIIMGEEIAGGAGREDQGLIELVDGIDEDQFASPVVYTRILGNGEQQTRLDHILITLYNHQTHHRGQVHVMLTQAGVTPTDIDVIYFLEEAGLS